MLIYYFSILFYIYFKVLAESCSFALESTAAHSMPASRLYITVIILNSYIYWHASNKLNIPTYISCKKPCIMNKTSGYVCFLCRMNIRVSQAGVIGGCPILTYTLQEKIGRAHV